MRSMRCVLVILALAAAAVAVMSCQAGNGGTTALAGFPSKAATTGTIDLEWFIPEESTGFPPEGNYVATQVAEKTGIHLVPVAPPADATERLNVLLAGKTYPDIIQFPDVSIQQAYITAGALWDLTGAIPRYAPNLYKNLGVLFDRTKQPDGKVYHIASWFRANGVENFPEHWASIFVRAKPLVDMGYKVPQTLDEVRTVLQYIKDHYKIIPMMLPLAEEGYQNYLYQTLGGSAGIIHDDGGPLVLTKDGTFDYIINVDGFRKALSVINEWYRAGLINPESATTNGDTLTQRLLAGDVAASIFGWPPASNDLEPGIQAKHEQPDTFYNVYAKLDSGVSKMTYVTNAVNYPTGQAITKNNKDPYRTMQMVNYLNSKDGLLTVFGKIGKADDPGFDHYLNSKNQLFPTTWLNTESETNPEYATQEGLWFYNAFGPDTSNWPTAPGLDMLTAELDVSRWWPDLEKTLYPKLGFNGIDYWPRERSVAVDITSFSGLPLDPSTDVGLINIDISDYLGKQIPKLVLAKSTEAFNTQYDEMVKTVQGYGLDKLLTYYKSEYDKRKALWKQK